MEDFDNIIKLYADKIELLSSQIDDLVEDSKTLELLVDVLLKKALRDMQTFERKYRQLQETAAVIKQMESTRQE